MKHLAYPQSSPRIAVVGTDLTETISAVYISQLRRLGQQGYDICVATTTPANLDRGDNLTYRHIRHLSAFPYSDYDLVHILSPKDVDLPILQNNLHKTCLVVERAPHDTGSTDTKVFYCILTADLPDGWSTPVQRRDNSFYVKPMMPLPTQIVRRSLNTDPLTVVSPCDLIWENGLEFCIDAVANLYHSGFSLRYKIIGQGEYKDALLYAIRQWGLWEKGIIEVIEAPANDACIRNADIVLYAPFFAQLNISLIKAQGMGIPVVVSNVDWLSRLVSNGETGYAIPARNPDEMISQLRLLLDNADLRQRVGHKGREFALQNFGLTNPPLMELYRAVLDEG